MDNISNHCGINSIMRFVALTIMAVGTLCSSLTAVTSFDWSVIPDPQYKDAPFNVTITAKDSLGGTDTSFNSTVGLSGLIPSGGSSGILITEVDTSPDIIEFQNVGTTSVDVSGWVVITYHGTVQESNLTLPSGTIVPAGAIFTLVESGSSPGSYPNFYSGTSIGWVSSSNATVILKDDSGNFVDVFTSGGTPPLGASVPASQWTNGLSLGGSYWLRSGNSDNNSISDWSSLGTNAVGTQNPNLAVPFSAPVLITPTVSGNFVNGTWSGSITVLESAAGMSLKASTISLTPATGTSNSFDVNELRPLTVTITPDEVSEVEGVVFADVSVSTPVTGSDLTVNLWTDDGSEATVDATVDIPVGFVSSTFLITVIDDTELDGAKPVNVWASAIGYDSIADSFDVLDDEGAIINLTLPTTVTEGQGIVVATVTVDSAPTEDATIHLSSGDETELTVPSSVVIPAGQTSATFNISVVNDGIVDGTQFCDIIADARGAWTLDIVSVEVSDVSNTQLMVDIPADAMESAGTLNGQGTVSIASAAASNLQVSLVSGDTGELMVPALVVIPAGETSVLFDMTVVDDFETDGAQNVLLTASATGFTSGNDIISIGDDDVHHFGISIIGSPVLVGGSTSVTLTALNVENNPISTFTGMASLSAQGDGGSVPVSPDMTASFSSGTWTGPVTFQGTDTNVELSVTDIFGFSGSTSNSFDVVAGALDYFEWDQIPDPQFKDVPVNVTVTARDQNGFVATSFDGTVDFSGPESEVTVGTGTSTWGLPLYTTYRDARTQTIYTAAELGLEATQITGLSLDVVTTPGQTLNNWTIRIKHTPLSSYSISSWESTDWVVVYQNDENISSTGWTLFEFDVPFEYDGTSNIMVDYSFNNSTSSSSGTVRYTSGSNRSLNRYYNDSYGDPLLWSGTSNPTPSRTGYYPNARFQTSSGADIDTPVSGNFVNGVWTGAITILGAANNFHFNASDANGRSANSNSFDVNVLPALWLGISSDEATEGDGVVSATVGIPEALASDLTIDLLADNASQVSIPTSVVIPAGDLVAVFDVTVVDDSDLDGTQLVNVTASTHMYIDGVDSITILDNESATLTLTLPVNASENDAPLIDAGTVTASAASLSDVVVTLTSLDTTEIIVPATVTIPAGQTTATFDIEIVNDTEIDSTVTVEITAEVGGSWVPASATMDVLDNDAQLTVQLPINVLENAGTIVGGGTVTIGGVYPTNLMVTLSSDNTSKLQVPSVLLIPAGQTSANFDLALVNDFDATGSFTVTVTASATGFTPGSTSTSVDDDDVHHFGFDVIASPQIAGDPVAVVLTALDMNDQPVVGYSGIALLSGIGDSGTVDVSPLMISSFTNGVWSGNLTVNNIDTNVELTADDGFGATGTSNAFDLTHGPIDHFTWDVIPDPQFKDVPVNVTINAKDSNGNQVSDYTGTVNLAGPDSEITVGTGTTTFSRPFYTSYRDGRTQTIYPAAELGLGGTQLTSLSLYVSNDPGQILNAWTIRIKHTNLAYYSSYTFENNDWTTVYQNNESIVGTGWRTFEFDVPFAYDGTSNLMIDFTFNNSSWSSAGYVHATSALNRRSIYRQSDGSTDPLTWTGTGTSSNYYPNIKLGTTGGASITPEVSGSFVNGSWSGAITVLDEATGFYFHAYDASSHTGNSNSFDVELLPNLGLDITLDEATEGDGVLAGTVSIPEALASNLTVNLAVDDASEITVLSSLQIPAGATSMGFNFTVVDDSDLDGSQVVSWTASAAGYISANDSITIHDNEVATLTLTVPASAAEDAGVLVDAGSVTLDSAPTSDIEVTLVSDDATAVIVPATVTILAGQTSVNFNIEIVDDNLIDTTQTVEITAAVGGTWLPATDTVDILDNDSQITLQVPANLSETAGTLSGGGTVTIGEGLTSDLVVSLTSDNTSELQVTPMILIPVGQTSGTFNISIVNDFLTDGAQTVNITATATGLIDGNASTTISDDDLHHFELSSIATQEVNVSFNVTVTAKSIDNATIDSYSGTGFISGAGDSGSVVVNPSTTGIFSNGEWTGSLAINGVDSNIVLTVEDVLGNSGASNAFDVTSGPLHHFEWSSISSPQYKDAPINVTITAVDASGYTVENYTAPADLSAWANGGSSTTVEILTFTGYADLTREYPNTLTAISNHFPYYNETTTTTQDAATLATELFGKDVFLIVEQENAVDVSNLGTAWASVLNNFVNGGGTVIACSHLKNEHMILHNAGLMDIAGGINLNSVTVRPSVPHYLNDGIIGLFTASSVHSYTSANGTAVMEGLSGGEVLVYQRSLGAGNVVMIGTDFYTTGTNMDRIIANAVEGNQKTSVPITPDITTGFVNGVWTGSITVSEEHTNLYLRVQAGVDFYGTSNLFDVEILLGKTFTSWSTEKGLTGPAAELDADPDLDGISNVLEYAFNLEPTSTDNARLVRASGVKGMPSSVLDDSDDRLDIEYVRRTNALDLTYEVQFSENLINWSAATGTEVVTSIDADWERVQIEDTEAVAAGNPRFIRVRVTQSN